MNAEKNELNTDRKRDRILIQIWRTAIVNLGVSEEDVVQVGKGKFNRLALNSIGVFYLRWDEG